MAVRSRALSAVPVAIALLSVLPIALPGQAPQAARDDEPLRPRVHFTPARNFMNDPNGLVFYDGEYHLFYQHNPFGDRWGHMSWGHAVSRDLLHWEDLPVALREEGGVMIFSGSAVVDRDNTSGLCAPQGDRRACLVAVYTGHGHGKQTQNLAYSTDRGRTWTKYAGNPVLDLNLKEFRDPKVFWHEPTRRWVMLTVLADQHKVRLFASPDLKRWETLSDFGPAAATGGVWECPDLFPLPVDGDAADVRWVLDVDLNPGGLAGGSGGQYFVGTFDGTRFTSENDPATTLWVDHGKDFYATISFSDIPPSDGRRIWMGWMSNWLYANEEPTSPWRGAFSVPRQLALRRTPDGVRLVQSPVKELESLRETPEPVALGGTASLPPAADLQIELRKGAWQETGLRLANGAGEEVVVGVVAEPPQVFVDRRRSRATAFHEAYPGRHAGPVRWRDGTISLRVIFDRSMLEVFANDGETVISDRVYPTRPFDRIDLLPGAASGGRARLWPLRSVWR
jgi:sucrose-6-phosphate hydrolase SacC (GH32 family)